MNTQNQNKWYKTWWGILIIIGFLPIVIPIFVWTKTAWPKGVKIAISVICSLFLLAGINTENQPSTTAQSIQPQTQATETTQIETKTALTQENKEQNETTTQEEKQIEETADEKIYYDVVKVTDGDTISVNIDGTTEKIRMIGMDTPETVDPRKPVQCFGKEASNKTKELLEGQKASLESDPTQGDRDKYNRLLRYVYLEDCRMHNKTLNGGGGSKTSPKFKIFIFSLSFSHPTLFLLA